MDPVTYITYPKEHGDGKKYDNWEKMILFYILLQNLCERTQKHD